MPFLKVRRVTALSLERRENRELELRLRDFSESVVCVHEKGQQIGFGASLKKTDLLTSLNCKSSFESTFL